MHWKFAKHSISLKKKIKTKRKKERKENKRIKIYRIKIEDNEHSFPVHPIKLNEPFDYPRSGV